MTVDWVVLKVVTVVYFLGLFLVLRGVLRWLADGSDGGEPE